MTVTNDRSAKKLTGANAQQDTGESGTLNAAGEITNLELDRQSLRLCYQGRQIEIRNSLGAQYLYDLLLHPRQGIAAEELFHRYHDRSDGQNYLYHADAGSLETEGLSKVAFMPIAMTDPKALREIFLRLKGIRSQLAEKAQWSDDSGLEDLYHEEEQLESYLSEVINPRGKIRSFGGEQRKLVESVSRALRRAIARINEQDAELGAFLQKTVHCWGALEYEPERGGV